MHRSTIFGVSAEQMVGEGEAERGDVRLTNLPVLRAALAQGPAAWRAELARCSNWRAMQVLPHLFWFDVDRAGVAMLDFGAWDTAFLLHGGMGVMELAHLVRRYTSPSASNTEQSFRHKLNAWGFCIERVPRAGAVHTLHLARTDSLCDFRFERCNWQVRACVARQCRCCCASLTPRARAQTFPWARCRGTKRAKPRLRDAAVHKQRRALE